MTIDELYELTAIDPWFLAQMRELIEAERGSRRSPRSAPPTLRAMKRMGFSDRQLGELRGETETDVRERRWALGVRPAYKMVDTCAGEFPSTTPYLYSSYDDESEAPQTGRKSVIILGSGPNRIGQGVEFDYCCVRAVMALREQGYETIMINSNPETVSTDYDISDKLYFEPLTLEDVLEIVQREQPIGVIVQLGGQTPLKLTRPLEAAGVHDPGHVARRDRHGRGSASIREDRAGAGHPSAGRTGPRRASRRRSSRRDAYRLSRAGAAVLRARRTCDADRLRRAVVARLFRARRRACREERPVLIDSFPRGRVRSRCRCALGRQCASSSAASCSTSRMPGIHSAIPRVCFRRTCIAETDIATMKRAHGRAGQGVRRRWADQRAVRRSNTALCTCSR